MSNWVIFGVIVLIILGLDGNIGALLFGLLVAVPLCGIFER